MLHVTSAQYISGFCVKVSFDDGAVGVADLQNKLHGPIFEPLKEPEYFKQLRFDPQLKTIVWPNGADLAPEFLRALLH